MKNLGNYELLDVIGTGGMGQVYRARDEHGRLIALKVIDESKRDEADYVKYFRRESELVARMNSPHIVPIHTFGTIDGTAYLDMRYVDGSSLARVVRDFGPASLETAIRIIEQAASALDDAHAAGVVHRDVKPANLLIDKKGFVYLADFGIAVVDRAPADRDRVIGSWPYMAPERFTGAEIGPVTDTYSLACVLCFALTGAPPYAGNTLEQQREAHMYAPPPNLMGRVDRMTPELNGLIAWGLAKDPTQRPRSAGEWAERVKEAIERAGHGYPSIPPAPPTAQHGSTPIPAPHTHEREGVSRPLIIVLVILVMVASALAAIVVHGGL